MKPGHTTTKRIAVLHCEGDAYTAEIVRAALSRSFTPHQVGACLYHRFNATVACPLLINPSDSHPPLLPRTLDSGGKALVLGSMGPGIAEQLGPELRTSAPLAPGLDAAAVDPSEPFNPSPARVQYVGDHPVAVAAVNAVQPGSDDFKAHQTMHRTTLEQQEAADRSTQEVKAFFDTWTVYEKAMDANYFGHREAYGALRDLLIRQFPDGFSLVDFGCGDASFMSGMLVSTAVRRYVGVDISRIALDMARTHMGLVPCDKEFIEGHFATVVAELKVPADVIWIGLNLHHLPLGDKDRFFRAAKRLLKPGGTLVFFEPMCRAGETRTEHAQRWWKACQEKWNVLSRPEMESLRDHIFSADYPETFAVMQELARCHGFDRVQSLFHDPDELYEMVSLACSPVSA